VAAELRRRHPRARRRLPRDRPRVREYERASTTAVDAYLSPLLGRYLGALADACTDAGLPAPLVMRSSGGRQPSTRRLRTPPSRPSPALPPASVRRIAGSRASATPSRSTWAARRRTWRDRDGVARRARASRHGLPVRLPTLAVHTVEQGRSIVRLDEGGATRRA
jgi:hypothetical protein